MFSNTFALIVVLIVCVVLLSLRNIFHMLSEKVRIYTIGKKGGSTLIGVLDYSNNTDSEVRAGNEAAVVRLVGASFDTPYIGRVACDNTPRAIVHVLDSDLELEAENPFYRTYGYVDADGFVHEKVQGRDVKIGYLAQPSHPNIPTIKGEWHWYSFWTRELNAYIGKPLPGRKKGEAHPQPEPENRQKPVLAAHCVREGFHFGESDPIPSEARAAGYALFFNKKRSSNNYSEYYNNPSHLWRDTALLASIVYCILYLTLFIINDQVMNVPLFGRDLVGIGVLSCFYFVVWAAVREIKMTKAEMSSSIKPQLDLLNKNVGIGLTDWMITIVAGILVALCIAFIKLESYLAANPVLADVYNYLTNFTHYDFDFLPLVIAILIGLSINRMQRSVPLPWTIRTAMDDTPEDAGDDVVRNPKGKIDVTYDWDLDSFNSTNLHGQVTLHFNKEEYIDELRHDNPFYPQVIDHVSERVIREMFNYMFSKPQSRERVRYLAYYMRDLGRRYHLADIDQMQFALDFVQEPNIMYREVHGSKSLDFAIHYMRYPDETLFDKEGDYNCKALLAAALFYEMGSNVLFLYSERFKTAAVAVEYDEKRWSKYYVGNSAMHDVLCDVNGCNYIYCDVASDNYRIGFIDEGRSIHDFDIKVEFTHEAEDELSASSDTDFDSAIPSAETKDITYQWTLDSRFGATLEGVFTLHFEDEEIDRLRSANPFLRYGKNGMSLEENISEMYEYMRNDKESLANVKRLADYIRFKTSSLGLNKADTLQFILDFVQTPNISYCYDKESAAIGFPMQYVRYPNETLYDKMGDCDCKTMLASMLFKECGYKTLFLISTTYEHAALAVECSDELLQLLNSVMDNVETVVYGGSRYIFCETTGDGFKVGQISEGSSVDNFEIKIACE